MREASGALELPVTWASRTEHPDGKTSPEEPAAAAHSAVDEVAELCPVSRLFAGAETTVTAELESGPAQS